MAETDDWAPKTREDWVGLFAEGHLTADQKREEAARAKAEEDAKNNPPKDDPTKDEPPAKRSFASKLLGK